MSSRRAFEFPTKLQGPQIFSMIELILACCLVAALVSLPNLMARQPQAVPFVVDGIVTVVLIVLSASWLNLRPPQENWGLVFLFAWPFVILGGLLIIGVTHCLATLALYSYLSLKNPDLATKAMSGGVHAASYLVLITAGLFAAWFRQWFVVSIVGMATGVLLVISWRRRSLSSRAKF